MTAPEPHAEEWHRLSTVSSPAARLAPHVEDLTQVRADELPGWLRGLGLAAGWQLASVPGPAATPSRIAVRIAPPGQHGYGCQTLALYRFGGALPPDAVDRCAATTLQGLRADAITTRRLSITPPIPGVMATCATGRFGSGAQPVWAQCCTYVAGPPAPDHLLLEHHLFIDARGLAALAGDVVELSRVVHAAFLTAARTLSATDATLVRPSSAGLVGAPVRPDAAAESQAQRAPDRAADAAPDPTAPAHHPH